MLILFLWLILFAPILYLPGMGGFEAPKVILLLLISALALWWQLRATSIKIRRPKTSLALAAVIIYAVVRNGWTLAPNYAWFGTENSHFGVIAWVALLLIALLYLNWQPKTLERRFILPTALISLVGMLAVIILQVTGVEGIKWYLYDDPSRARTIIGSIGGSGHLGIFILLLAGSLIPLIKRRSSAARSWLVIFGLLLALIALVYTKSLSGLAGLLFLLVLAILHYQKRLSATLCSLIVSVIIALPVFFSTPAGSKLADQLAPSLADRAVVWQSANQSLSDPDILLFGAGMEQFQTVYDQHYPASRVGARALTEEHAHSLLYELLTEWGLVGLALIILVVSAFVRESRIKDHWFIVMLLVWLLMAQVNIVTVVFWPLLLLYLLLGTLPSNTPVTLRPGKYRLWWQGVAAGWLLLVALTVNSSLAFSLAQEKGSLQSADFDFTAAARTFRRSATLPLAHSFSQLEYAEALTNRAIQDNDFVTDQEVLLITIKRVTAGASTARNTAIILSLLARWAPTSQPAFTLYNKIGHQFLDQWSTHPQYAALTRSLRGQVN